MSTDRLPLPKGWAAPRLDEIARINPPAVHGLTDDNTAVNFVPMRAVEAEGGGLLRPETRPYGEVKKGYTSFLSGDVIMAKITPCMENGKVCVVPDLPGKVCFGSTEFHVIRPETGVQARWIAQFLLQHETLSAAQRQMSGAVGQMRVPVGFLEGLRVPLAPLPEQIRIADTLDELLSDLDAGVAALMRVREKLKLFRASVLKAAVEGMLTAEWRKQRPHTEPASELLKRILVERWCRWEEDQLRKFKEKGQVPPKNWKTKYKEPVTPDITNLPSLPDGWCWASLDQICEIQGGLQKSPQRTPTRNHYPYLRVANVYRGYLDLNELHRFELTSIELERLRLQCGDILIVEGNGSRTEIGRCAVWRGEVEDCVHQNHIIRARPITGIISAYVNTFLNSPTGQNAVQWVASSTSGLYTLSVAKIERLPVALMPTDEQVAVVEAIEDQTSVIDHLEASLNARLKGTEVLRQSILRQAFTGQLVPQDASDESASELLERIATAHDRRHWTTNDTKRASSSKRTRRERACR